MISRMNGFGLGVALSLASASLTHNAPALAQEDAPPTGALPIEGSEAAATPAAEAPAEAPTEAPAAETEEKPAAVPEEQAAEEPEEKPAAKSSVSAEAKVSVSAPELPTAPAPTPKTDAQILPVVELPGSAYPSIQIRGLANGSLARTFHGMQWPNMRQVGGSPGLQIGLSGSVWSDLSNTRITVDENLGGAGLNDQNRWTTQTRGVLRVTPTYNAGGDWFAQANMEFVALGDMRADVEAKVLPTTDDVWVRAGMWDVFDVTFGRFQGWEIANHYGMALDINTLERSGAWIVASSLPKPTGGYGLTYFWDRQDSMLGTYAVHLYPTKYLRGELLGHVGGGTSLNAATPYQVDVRPSAIFDVGFLKLKAGYEYGKVKPQDTKQKGEDSRNGYGFAAQVVLDPYVEFGGSFARGFQDVVDDKDAAKLDASDTVQSVGGFLNASPGHEPLVFGFGAFLNSREDFRVDQNEGKHQGKVDTNDQWLLYGAVQYTLWTRLNLKFVVSHASNKVEDYNAGNYVNNALSGRFRAEVLF